MHYFSVLFNVIVAYTFFGLDEVSRQLENPFGKESYSLPLCAIVRNIEISMGQSLGIVVPEKLAPNKDGLLM